jgi:TonB family protein
MRKKAIRFLGLVYWLAFFLLPITATATSLSTQQDTLPPEETPGFMPVDKTPEFPGGNDALIKFLGKELKYPKEARDQGISGVVVSRFVVEKDGSISNPVIIRDIGGGCGEEVLRVISTMPKWKPGEQRGQPVRVQFNLPVSFRFTDDEVTNFAGTPEEQDAVMAYYKKHIHYTSSMRASKTQGIVILRAKVKKSGKIGKSRIIKSLGPEFDKEAQRVVKNMPYRELVKESVPQSGWVLLEVPFDAL